MINLPSSNIASVQPGLTDTDIFSAALDPAPWMDQGAGPDDILAAHFVECLDLLTPTHKGRDINVDGYRLHRFGSSTCRLGDIKKPDKERIRTPHDISEPRMAYIRRTLNALLAVVDLEHEGKKVSVDGFRLKDPKQWIAPMGGASDILADAAASCNVNCRFCYNHGAPPLFQNKPQDWESAYREAMQRIQHYSPQMKRGIFSRLGSPCEFLAHPRSLDILDAMREKTGEVLRIATNGSALSPVMIEQLAAHKPVFLDISLNSASPARRKWLMRDPKPQTAINGLAGLGNAGVPFSVVIVPWPFPSKQMMLEDLDQTVGFAAQKGAAFIQISLPGHTRFFSDSPIFDSEEIWESIKTKVKDLRNRVECPVILRPGMYETYEDPDEMRLPRVIGTIPGSPGRAADVRPGDVLTRVGGLAVRNRVQAGQVLSMLEQSGQENAVLTVIRGEQQCELEIDTRFFRYPYTPEIAGRLGIVFSSSGIPDQWLEQVRRTADSYGAKHILVLTSRLVAPGLKQAASEAPIVSDLSLTFKIPENRYLGGTILMGDLLVVSDFIAAVEAELESNDTPLDLVIIPSSPFHLSGWGRDLTGRTYKEIERRTRLPVAMVECNPIFD